VGDLAVQVIIAAAAPAACRLWSAWSCRRRHEQLGRR